MLLPLTCAFRVATAGLLSVSLQWGRWSWNSQPSGGCSCWVWDIWVSKHHHCDGACNGWGWSRAMWRCWEATDMSPLLLQGSPEVQAQPQAGMDRGRFSSVNTSSASLTFHRVGGEGWSSHWLGKNRDRTIPVLLIILPLLQIPKHPPPGIPIYGSLRCPGALSIRTCFGI